MSSGVSELCEAEHRLGKAILFGRGHPTHRGNRLLQPVRHGLTSGLTLAGSVRRATEPAGVIGTPGLCRL